MSDATNIDAARRAGYSDSEILSHLASRRGIDIEPARKYGYSNTEILEHIVKRSQSAQPPPKPREQQSALESAGTDISIGWRRGMSHLAHTASNVASGVGATGVAGKLREYEKTETPTEEETTGRDGIVSQVSQGIGELVPGLTEYAPALLARRYAPIAAGVIGAVGAADKGGWEAAEAGLEQAASFELMHRASKLPTLKGRIAGSALASAAPAVLSGGDQKSVASAAILGGALGAIGGKTKAGAPKVPKIAEESIWDDFRRNLSPLSRGPNARKTAEIMRPYFGERFQRQIQVEHALRETRNYFDKLKENPANAGGIADGSLDFIHKIETGSIHQLAPELQAPAKVIRQAFDQRLKEIQNYGLLNHFVTDYFPHLFKRPEVAKQAAAQILSKRPIEGGKNWAKQRTFLTVRDALDFSKQNPSFPLELISNNPIDVVMLQLREQDKFITGIQTLEQLQKQGMLIQANVKGKPPTGYRRIDQRIPSVLIINGKKTIQAGEWFAPSDAAQVINNYLSPGMTGKPWFRVYSQVANATNMFQLGFSAFHLGFTTYESMVSQVALGIEKAVHGARTGSVPTLVDAAATIAKAPVVPFEWASRYFRQMSKSDKLAQEYIHPGSNPALAPMVKALKAAGGTIEQDPYYRMQFERQFVRAWRNAHWGTALVNLAPAITERPMRLIMEHMVPIQKLGAFHRLAEFEINKLGPKATEADLNRAFQKAWDTVDNRFGQLTYDNLFWNKMAKDLLMTTVRSVGWNFGTIREVGGGLKDWKSAAADVANGKRIDFSHRMAYTIAMPLVVGSVGGIITYLNTGKAPQEIDDYFYPKTGRVDENGNPERTSQPSYVRDVANVLKKKGEGAEQYLGRLGSIAKGKMHPMLSTIIDMIENKDWRNEEIRNSDDPLVKQLVDSAKYVAEQVIPFSMKYSLEDVIKSKAQGKQRQYTTGQSLGAIVGFTPAPAQLNRKAYEWAEDKYPRQDMNRREKADVDKKDAKADLYKAYRNHRDEEFDTLSKKAIDKGILTDKEVNNIQKAAEIATPARVVRFKGLKMEHALSVYFNYVMTDKTISKDEKRELLSILAKKVSQKWGRIESLEDGDRDKIKYRNMLRVLNMLDENGEPQAAPEEDDGEDR